MKSLPKQLWVHVAGIVAIALALCVLIGQSDALESASRFWALGFVVVSALGILYGVLVKYLNAEADHQRYGAHPYHRFFFGGTGVLTVTLTVLGLISALFVYFDHENIFQALGLVVSVTWVAVFLRYFMWSVYHYNINYGLTDREWQRIFEAREKQRMGFPVSQEDLTAPDKNPYRSQTFGLPPGTVRGMIAFTLLMGGLSLLIASFGTEYSTSNQLALIRQQFEFFETAFLMMIAFYFGDKSLKYLQRRWTTGAPSATAPAAKPPARKEMMSELDVDDLALAEEDRELERVEQEKGASALTARRKVLSAAVADEPAARLQGSFVQVKDNIFGKVLSDEEIEAALHQLQQEEGIRLSLPVVKAILEVESSGRGHLPDGRPKILFEGHRFWFWLEKFGKNPAALQAQYPELIYRNWTTKHYRLGAKEYERLDAARQIDAKAAVYATSWGLFQILGENLEHNIKARLDPAREARDPDFYKDYNDFVEKQGVSEYYHFLDFLAFIKTKTARGKPLIEYISEARQGTYDWASFAYGYNGSGYKTNQYDVRLQAAYARYRTQTPASEAGGGWVPMLDAGHGGMKDGVYQTPPERGKRYEFADGTKIYEGDINRRIGRMLMDLLQEAGIPFYDLTVSTVDDTSLTERVEKANALYRDHPNAYFLSIHSNSSSKALTGAGGQANGFEVWTSVGQTKSDELASVVAQAYKQAFPEFKFRQDMTDGDPDREMEVESKSFYVLRKTRCPALLVENLFYDNRLEAQFLLSEAGQRRIARCLFNAVRDIHQNVHA
ncbi:N-acetylmuramoyl-L-alanine amidase [Catalinimonas alkaloidigena]|uniref:N-acetylmuramoyl-L-alanine amidase n=1 Tax=Catalinimonas alkaloidigena TaxID=1075417 RepID=A0A1G9SIG7_9BACT|nr:N-acetylmuramidase domain-containing protein [Catalinimonas alkaloidigena]SDM35097.1 N-acetylmuramoyl-L-alanine amidase [Catalinimonas alkaloidigena]